MRDGRRDVARRQAVIDAVRRNTFLLCLLCAVPSLTATMACGRMNSIAARSASRGTVRGLRPHVFQLARQAYECGRARGYFQDPLLTVIDYSLPSTERRLWVLNVETGDVLFHELVAHGRNSGENEASDFSNRPGSKQSSLGLFQTDGTYHGKHGYSLRISGLEPGFNDLAFERAIVIHGAPYVNPYFAARHGRLGRSWGCPALPASVSGEVIDAIKDGTAVFAYYPDDEWLTRSRFLHCDQQIAGR